METYGSLPPTGWSTGVVTNILQDNIVDGEDAEGCLGGVSGGDHPGHHLHSPTRVHQAGVRDVPGQNFLNFCFDPSFSNLVFNYYFPCRHMKIIKYKN